VWQAVSVTGFDGELYLRLCAERMLLAGDQNSGWHGPLTERARALVAVDAVPCAVAQRVVDDYAWVRAVRGIGRPHRRRNAARSATPTTPIGPRRVVPCGREIGQSWGRLQLRYASFGEASTRLAVILWFDAPPSRAIRRRPRGPSGGGPPTIAVTDDRGTTASADFSGGGSDIEWRGHYRTDQPLAPDTRWIELLGERIDLPDRAGGAPVEIEYLGRADPAERYLERYLEGLGDQHPHGGSVDDVIEALIACGALAPEATAVGDTLTVAEALWPTGGGPPTATTRTLPQPWRSLLAARGRGGGPAGMILVGATTPVFEGMSAAVMQLESTDESFQIEVEIAGSTPVAAPFPDDLDRVGITYTASDDRGSHYLGGLAGWSGSNERLEGQVEFWPALDPRAHRLDLALTAQHSRAVVRVPLVWDVRA